ncbi:hypothetical protein GYMLUDRAFT_170283, partial [Collybiopsis luxurians FD-317 M1]
SSEERDPGLNKGQAYMVDDHVLQQFIAIFQGRWPPEKSDCSDHNAVKLANRCGDHNLATTGLALSSCARHDTIHAHSGVDLRLGEEYLLMDFSLLSSIRSFPNLPVTVSYDIMCQYSKKLYQRIAAYPQILHTPIPFPRYQLLVPKFHLAAHKQDCVWSFSYNYAIGVGRTDGEGVERNWSTQNSLSGSTKKMGPGSRRNTLDDHFGDHNWRKIISIANHIRNKALEAAKVREQMVLAYQDACQGINNSTQTLWRKMVMDWEQDPDKKNQTHMSPKLNDKISACATHYRTHFSMLERFSEQLGKVHWTTNLRPLKNEDIRSILHGKDNDCLGEGYVITSWIWNTSGVDHTDEANLAECLQVSWCKARARALRWQEECVFLQEEMRRVKKFFDHEQKLWESRAEAATDLGIRAYAYRQAAIRERIRAGCIEKWKDLDTLLSNGAGGFSLHEAPAFVY